MRWEYKVTNHRIDAMLSQILMWEAVEKQLDDQGEQEWELIKIDQGVLGEIIWLHCVWKRPVS